MKFSLRVTYTLLCALSLLFSACHREDIPNPYVETVRASLDGIVSDPSGAPLSGVMIRVGSQTTFTDNQGHFMFYNILLCKDKAYVTANLSGYFEGSRTFQTVADAINHVEIMLVPKGNSFSVSGTSGGTITLNGGATIDFPSDAFVDASGSAYTGNVSVYAYYLCPCDGDINKKMPGMLYGQRTDNSEGMLISHGMINAELYGSNGEKLQLAPNKLATIRMPSISSGIGGSIPTWYFDVNTGLWKEDGSATIDATGTYTAEVSHFTWWNCDAFQNAINLTFTVVDNSGMPLGGIGTYLSLSNGMTSNWANYSASNGVVTGAVPANEIMDLVIFDTCGDTLYYAQVGPFNSNTDLGNIAITVQSSNAFSITGMVNDCDGSPLADGVFIGTIGSQSFSAPIINGTYTLHSFICGSSSGLLQGQYYSNNSVGFASVQSTVTAGNNTLASVMLTGCGTAYVMTGNVLDCSSNPVTAGIVSMYLSDGQIISGIVSNGTYSITCYSTSTPLSVTYITAIDTMTNLSGSQALSTILSPAGTSLPTITICPTAQNEYIIYTVDNITTSYTIGLKGLGNVSNFNFQLTDSLSRLVIDVSSNVIPHQLISLVDSNTGISLTPALGTSIQLSFTAFPVNIGDYYEGAFQGVVQDSTATQHNISAQFRVQREQ